MKRVLVSAVILVSVLMLSVFAVGCAASAKETKTEKAYEIILGASDSFKDPSSVRVISGDFFVDSEGRETLCIVLSANNSFGGRGNGYYIVYPTTGLASRVDDDIFELVIEKQGKKLGTGTPDDQMKLYEQCQTMFSKEGFDYDKINEKLIEHWKNF